MNNIGIGDLCQHTCSMLPKVIYVSICYLSHLTMMAEVIYVSIDYMSEYMYNDGIGDLNHHRLSMSGIHVSIDSLCQNT